MSACVSRRACLATALAGAGSLLGAASAAKQAGPQPPKLPRWHGFNLQPKFMAHDNRRFEENDFALIKELGFNFVRIPMDYRCWIESGDWTRFNEAVLKEIDEGVGFAEKHGLHMMLNFHRAPGYTVAQPAEPLSLWTDETAQRVCAMHWAKFAERYKGIPNARLSFNLFNEPAMLAAKLHRPVVERVLEAIRQHDTERLVVCDGRRYGCVPPLELLDLGVAASTRGYEPFHLTHYQASWVNGADQFPLPSYPLKENSEEKGKAWFQETYIKPWKEAEARGMSVMVGEFGCFNRTPHAVTLAWMKDLLDLWGEAGWGWALWNFRGEFGVLDSKRADVPYETWHGHQLDRAMLELLQSHAKA